MECLAVCMYIMTHFVRPGSGGILTLSFILFSGRDRMRNETTVKGFELTD